MTRTLLEATDTRNRLVQHGAVVAAIAMLVMARAAAEGNLAIASVLIAVALGLLGVAAVTFQRWTVDYRGHRILYENNPLRGEKLLIDGARVAKGRFGVRSEMRATIASGEGAGDEIVALSEAGLLRFRCRIQAMPSAAIQASDDRLLAEVRRRGLV